jgi:hypothetical protein
MSNNYSKTIDYHCTSDCRQEGCPGHKLRLIYHGSSDTVSVEIDGKCEYIFDDDLLAAICTAAKSPMWT